MSDDDDDDQTGATYAVSGTPWGTAEGERRFLSIRPDPDSSAVLRGFDYTFVPNADNPDATVEITLHHQRRGKVEGTWDSTPYWLSKLKAGEAIRLPLDSNETLALFRQLQDLYAIGAHGIPRGQRSIHVQEASDVITTGPMARQIKQFVERHGEANVLAGLEALLPDPLAIVGLTRVWAKRSAALEVFETHLAWKDWTEFQWQSFFRENDWIFGHGLDYQFLVTQQAQPDYGGQDLAGRGGQRGDVLMSTAGDRRFAVLVELKKPQTDLVGEVDYRNGAWSIGEELANGVAQLQANTENLLRKAEQGKANVDYLASRRMSATAPKGILLIGHTEQLDNDAKQQTFHRFRRHLWNPEVITYDELRDRARFLVDRASETVQTSRADDPEALDPEDHSQYDYRGSESPDDGGWDLSAPF